MTQDDFWSLFKRFVMFHPSDPEYPCARLDSWAVLKNLDTDLNSPALGMTVLDRGKSHFFSRAWAESKYNPNAIRHRFPLLAANIVEVVVERGEKDRVDNLSFELIVLDTLKEPKGPASACARRSEIEIFRDCHNRLQECFSYLMGAVVATVTPLSGPEEVFYGSPLELAYLSEADLIASYTLQPKETQNLQRRFKKMCENSTALPWRGGASQLYGVWAPDLVFSFHVCEDPLALDFPSYYQGAISERENY